MDYYQSFQQKHVYSSLVVISDHIVTLVNKIVYEFVWNGKTDKMKRNIFEQEYNKGGYKMINLEDIITATSIIWIKKYLDNTERDWKHTLEWLSKRKKLKRFLE